MEGKELNCAWIMEVGRGSSIGKVGEAGGKNG